MILKIFERDGLYHFADAATLAPVNGTPHPLSRGVSPASKSVITRRIIAALQETGLQVEALCGRIVDKETCRELGYRFKDTSKRGGTGKIARQQAKRTGFQEYRPGERPAP